MKLEDIPEGQRRPYSYEGNAQWSIDVNNLGLSEVRARERKAEQDLLEHEALTDFDVVDLLTVESFPHHSHGCHGCWVIHMTTIHRDRDSYQDHRLSCDERPCGPGVDIARLPYVADPSVAPARFTTGLALGIVIGLLIAYILTQLF